MWYGMREGWSDVVWNERGLAQCETRCNGVVWSERGLEQCKTRYNGVVWNDWSDVKRDIMEWYGMREGWMEKIRFDMIYCGKI